eukprot:scaffold156546_cov17-Prasinocladus_malaysianus.AAC.2
MPRSAVELLPVTTTTTTRTLGTRTFNAIFLHSCYPTFQWHNRSIAFEQLSTDNDWYVRIEACRFSISYPLYSCRMGSTNLIHSPPRDVRRSCGMLAAHILEAYSVFVYVVANPDDCSSPSSSHPPRFRPQSSQRHLNDVTTTALSCPKLATIRARDGDVLF